MIRKDGQYACFAVCDSCGAKVELYVILFITITDITFNPR